MKIVIVSGFLGSGKTTSVIKIGKYLQSNGFKVAVLVNDIGDVGVDGQVISENGLESKEMPRGCICCTLRYALEANIALVQAQYNPDILLIEPTGVAFPLRIKEQIEKMDFGPEVSMGPIIGLIDGSKFTDLMQHSEDAVTRQLKNADIILLNKKDMLTTRQLTEFETIIRDINPDASFFSLSMKWEEEAFMHFARELLGDLTGDMQVTRSTGGYIGKESIISSPGACLSETDDFNHFNVSSYADSYTISMPLDQDLATHAALELMQSIKNSIVDMNPRFLGHLKMFLHTGSVALKVSVTSYQDQPELELVSTAGTEENKVTVFAAVTDIGRDNLADIIENAVSARSGQLGIAA